MKDNIKKFCPTDKHEWREWLDLNHQKEEGVWLVVYKKGTPKCNISWSEAVDEALCFGWIDSVKRPMNDEKYIQYFSMRKATSTWSKINKQKIKSLKELGLMREMGLRSIEIAKENGSWTLLDSVEELEIPKDLNAELNLHHIAKDYYLSLSKSAKKSILLWIVMAKRPETREKRIKEVVDSAKTRMKPKHLR